MALGISVVLSHLSIASFLSTNSAEPDQTPKNVASDQDLHCLLSGCSKFDEKWENTTQQPLKRKWTRIIDNVFQWTLWFRVFQWTGRTGIFQLTTRVFWGVSMDWLLWVFQGPVLFSMFQCMLTIKGLQKLWTLLSYKHYPRNLLPHLGNKMRSLVDPHFVTKSG